MIRTFRHDQEMTVMKKLPFICVILAVIAIVMELFLFNFRTFESMTFPPVSGYTLTDEKGQAVNTGQTLAADKNGNVTFFVENINATVQNLYLDVFAPLSDSSSLSIQLYARDEGNNQYYDLPQITLSTVKESGKYIRLNLSGKAKSLQIILKDVPDDTIILKDIGLNCRRPLDFSPARLAAVYILLLILFAIRPASSIYRIKYRIRRPVQTAVITGLMLAELAIASGIAMGNTTYCDPPWAHHYQYHELAVSLTEGHFYLDIEPSQALLDMENPYDNGQRSQDHVEAQWDTAFYNGKYYCYFGILPVLVYYLPWYLFTGTAFPTFVGIIINTAVIIAGITCLLHRFIKRYFNHISFGVFLLLQTSMVLGCGVLLCVHPPTFYNMPGSMALALTLWGLYCWIRALEGRPEKGQDIDTALPAVCQPDTRFLAGGALLMALVAACRPQMLVGSFLILPFFWQHVKESFSRSGERKALFIRIFWTALPYVIVAGLLMYYNWARFGSPFDFGANYNLTTNDMTHRGFHLDRLPFGLFMYLIQPPEFTGTFPFMTPSHIDTNYQGTTIMETMYGGFFWFNLITGAVLFIRQAKNSLKEKGLWGITVLSLVMAVVVVCADIQMAGILQRYGCDFGIFFMIPSVLILMALYDRAWKKPALKKALTKIFFLVFIGTVVVNFFWVLAK